MEKTYIELSYPQRPDERPTVLWMPGFGWDGVQSLVERHAKA